MKPEEVPRAIKTPCILFGTGTRICEKELAGLGGVTVIHEEYDNVSGRALTDDRLKEFASSHQGNLLPIYGRRSEAEIKFNVNID